jgi:hypothetical protein
MEAWTLTESHIRRAHQAVGTPAIEFFHGFLERNEFELAADVLVDFGAHSEELPVAFWDALQSAYATMKLPNKATHCSFRRYQTKYGFVEAHLIRCAVGDGGTASTITTGYCPNWNIGRRVESGEVELNSAYISIECGPSIAAGGTGLVRLHPLKSELWTHVLPGAELIMHEGARVVGKAIVQRVALRRRP